MKEIHSKEELQFYIAADMMMNHGKFHWSWKDRLKHIVAPDYIMRYLKHLRYLQYLSCSKQCSPLGLCRFLFHKIRYRQLGYRLGFSIDYNALGYGVNIPHYGTIVVGRTSTIGNYAVLHTSICVTGTGNQIGDAPYISTGAKVISTVKIGDNVALGANCVVNKDIPANCMAAGIPAKAIKPSQPWYIRDGQKFSDRVSAIEALKAQMLG